MTCNQRWTAGIVGQMLTVFVSFLFLFVCLLGAGVVYLEYFLLFLSLLRLLFSFVFARFCFASVCDEYITKRTRMRAALLPHLSPDAAPAGQWEGTSVEAQVTSTVRADLTSSLRHRCVHVPMTMTDDHTACGRRADTRRTWHGQG